MSYFSKCHTWTKSFHLQSKHFQKRWIIHNIEHDLITNKFRMCRRKNRVHDVHREPSCESPQQMNWLKCPWLQLLVGDTWKILQWHLLNTENVDIDLFLRIAMAKEKEKDWQAFSKCLCETPTCYLRESTKPAQVDYVEFVLLFMVDEIWTTINSQCFCEIAKALRATKLDVGL